VNSTFTSEYNPTIVSDFAMKIFKVDGHEIRIQFWDIMGQERSVGTLNKLFCKGAKGALVVGDITD